MVAPKLPTDLHDILRHLEASYPSEACGLIFEKDGAYRTRLMQNVYDRYHAKDPVRYPRTSRTAYLFDPMEWLRASEEADQTGERVHCVFHSHIDVGAYFSTEDKVMAAPEGEPILPGVAYLVVSVVRGAAAEANVFWWDQGDWRESAVPLGR